MPRLSPSGSARLGGRMSGEESDEILERTKDWPNVEHCSLPANGGSNHRFPVWENGWEIWISVPNQLKNI